MQEYIETRWQLEFRATRDAAARLVVAITSWCLWISYFSDASRRLPPSRDSESPRHSITSLVGGLPVGPVVRTRVIAFLG